MRKIALFLAVVMLLALVACGKSDPAPTEAKTEQEDTTAATGEVADTTVAEPEETTEAEPVETTAPEAQSVPTGVEDGVLTVAMECAYAPYNWVQQDDSTAQCRSAIRRALLPMAMM